MKSIKRKFKNEGLTNNENCSVFDTQVRDIKVSRKKFDEIMSSKLSKDKENAGVKDVKTSNIEELTKEGGEMRRNANIKESRVVTPSIGRSKRVNERLHQLKEDKLSKSYEVIDDKIVKEKLTEAPVRDLEPKYDYRKSFYGKARVNELSDGSKVLISYDTPVVGIREGQVTLLKSGYLGWASSQTTLRHVKDFLQQEGFKAGSYKDLANMYPVQQYDDWRCHKEVMESTTRFNKRVGRTSRLDEDAISGEKVNLDTLRTWLLTGGATIKASTGEAVNYKEGYEISFDGTEKKFSKIDLNNNEDVEKVLNEVNKRLSNPKHPFIGLWTETSKDSKEEDTYKDVYVDYSEHFIGSEKDALILGKKRNQKAILRWNDMESVYVESLDNDTKKSVSEAKEFNSKEKLTGRVLKKQGIIEDVAKDCIGKTCDSKELREGYIGQTLRDFFGVCIEPKMTIKQVVLSDINEDEFDDSICFNGSYDELTDAELDYEFHEFDTFGEGVTINVGIDSGDDFYATVEDFLDDCNEDLVTIYDLDKGEVIFEGDRYEIPDEVLDMQFASFDAPKKITINVTCSDEEVEDNVEDFDSYDEDDSFNPIDESLKTTSDISTYEPWAGAVETFDKIKAAGMIDDLDFLLEDIYPDGITETQLNDILWFDADWVLESLGLKEEEYEEDDYE